ncbi:sodium:proline symporter, partial [Bacillus vallismortis]|nr:sodium:proline symporter [Bacillus vallismortis]
YVSSGMVSGGVLFNSIMGMDYHTGLWVVTGVVVVYTLLGGFLAVSWTDFVQGIIMFAALILVPIVTFFKMGGASETVTEIRSVDPDMFDI